MKIGRRASRQLQNKKRIGVLMKLPYFLADRACFSKLRERLGGRIRFFIAGGAALNPEVARFFHAGGLIILEGYGLTETSPVVTVNRLNSFRFGSIGKPLPNVEVKIADDGELCVRGSNVMMGYVNDQQRTRSVIDTEGWFHTGDLGRIDEDGFVFITGRKKEILVLSTGKKVSPNPIEKKLLKHKYVNQAMLVGDKRKFVSALIVPEFESIRKFASDTNISCKDNMELLKHDQIHGLFSGIIEDASQNFATFEKIKKFTLISREFDQVNGEMTPTMKLRRDKILENFHNEIEQMYRETAD
jgi:long-chain acyl-CoA synthetase